MGLGGDISDIQPELNVSTNANVGRKAATPGFKNQDYVNFYEGNSEDMSMLKDMTAANNDQSNNETCFVQAQRIVKQTPQKGGDGLPEKSTALATQN